MYITIYVADKYFHNISGLLKIIISVTVILCFFSSWFSAITFLPYHLKSGGFSGKFVVLFDPHANNRSDLNGPSTLRSG